ncbi:MAG: SPASM domain-containing protein [Oscillochloridaceae bacterium]|nr:SPASM domain-containing protein [Chloroflexaceae bacterium]MDW8388895.1 SPASM domain-containing protein [Oscillochloridaceae bacterium]
MPSASEFSLLFDHGDDPDKSEAVTDCDCACPVALPPPATPPPPAAPLYPHPDLRRLPLSDRAWVAFVPSFSRVAVLDQATWDLLYTPPPARPPDARAGNILATAHHLGLLIAPGEPPRAPLRPDRLLAWLHVTNACNLRCTYCYLHKSGERMSSATGRAAIDATFRSALAAGYQRVEFKYAGGEAPLHLERVAELHRYAASRGAEHGLEVRGRILSNGTTLTPQRLALIAELGIGLMVSLDGLGAEHDAQRPTTRGGASALAALNGLRRALACDLQPTVSITVTPQSVTGLPALLGELLDMGVYFTLNFARPVTAAAPAITAAEERIIEGLRAAYAVIAGRPLRYSLLGALLDRAHLGAGHRHACSVGEHYLVFDHRGNVAKCQMVINEPITTVAADDPLALIRADRTGVQNLAVEAKEGCRNCEWRYWCAGGCAVTTYRVTGRYDARSPNCRLYRALYPDVLRLEGLRLLALYVPESSA